MKGIIGLPRKLRRKREESNSHIRVWREQDSETNFPPLKRDPDRTQEWKISECTTVRPKVCRVDMRSKRNLHGIQHTNFAKSASRKGTARISTKHNFFRSDVHKGEEYRDRLGDTFQRRVYIVDSGAAFTYDGLSSLNHQKRRLLDSQTTFWIFRPRGALWSQAHKRRSASRNLTLVYGYIW